MDFINFRFQKSFVLLSNKPIRVTRTYGKSYFDIFLTIFWQMQSVKVKLIWSYQNWCKWSFSDIFFNKNKEEKRFYLNISRMKNILKLFDFYWIIKNGKTDLGVDKFLSGRPIFQVCILFARPIGHLKKWLLKAIVHFRSRHCFLLLFCP